MRNKLKIAGRILEELSFSHENYGEKYYTTKVAIKRHSSVEDIIPIIIPEKFYKKDIKDTYIEASGIYRSFRQDGHLKLYIWAKDVTYYLMELNSNEIYLKGVIAKPVEVRVTPKKKIVADMFLVVFREQRKSDYIPCIVWEENALNVERLKAGTKIEVWGRIQSREYLKNGEVKVAYEVSVNKLAEIKE